MKFLARLDGLFSEMSTSERVFYGAYLIGIPCGIIGGLVAALIVKVVL